MEDIPIRHAFAGLSNIERDAMGISTPELHPKLTPEGQVRAKKLIERISRVRISMRLATTAEMNQEQYTS